MKRMSAIAAALVLGTGAAVARPPMSRQAEGRIMAVEAIAHRFTFERADDGKRLALSWDRRTQFYRGAAQGSRAMLTPGQRARVSYRQPFFGPDYAGRVVLPAAAASVAAAPTLFRKR